MKHGNISIFVPHAGCPNQCSFCNQKIITGHSQFPTGEDVCRAVDTALASAYSAGAEMEIAFFGGSFTAIPRKEMVGLLEAAAPYVHRGQVKGIRISTRPDAVDVPILSLLKEYGVTAVELGAQSMDDEVLRLNRRGHTAEQTKTAAQRIHNAGFDLGLQMMTGLYGSTEKKDRETARQFLDLKPKTVRIYPTVVLKGTWLARQMAVGAFVPQETEAAAALCAALLLLFTEAGIPVIRLGLHSSPEVEANRVGGAYHPAFRELVENQIFLGKALGLLKEQPKGNSIIFVPTGCTSKMIGQKKCNLFLLNQLGYPVRVVEDSGLSIQEMAVRTAPEV